MTRDLEGKELDAAETLIGTLDRLNERAWVDPDALQAARLLQRMAVEIRRRRSTPPLTEQRAREVVRAAVDEAAAAYASGHVATLREKHDRIATRAAKELAGAVVGLSDADREALLDIKSLIRHADSTVERSGQWDRELVLVDRLLLATAFDRATLAVTGQTAADLTEQLADQRAVDALPPAQRAELDQLDAGGQVPGLPVVVPDIPIDLAETIATAIEEHAAWFRSDTGHSPEGIAALRAAADRLDAVAESIRGSVTEPGVIS